MTKNKYEVENLWITKAGYPAVAILVPGMHRCGYVGIPKEHILHGIGYSQSTILLWDLWEHILSGRRKEGENKRGPVLTLLMCTSRALDCPDQWKPENIINIHGGLTYSGGDDDYPIKNEKGLWWFGFDCGHFDDGSLMLNYPFKELPVRTLDYVEKECELLAEQLKEINIKKRKRCILWLRWIFTKLKNFTISIWTS